MEATILVAEESDATRVFLADNLTADGYEVITALNCADAIAKLREREVDAIVADLNGHTNDLIQFVNERLPMLVTHSRDELDRVRKLENGADDVMVKPFSYPELRARVAALLRRRVRPARRSMQCGPLTIDYAGRQVRVGENLVDVAPREWVILTTLAADPTRVFTKEELMVEVYGASHRHYSSRSLESHIVRCRNKLTEAGSPPSFRNVWGVGYKLFDPADVAASTL